MKAVTQNIKVVLTDDEKLALNTAKCILQNFADIMKDHKCSDAYFEQIGVVYYTGNLEGAIDLLDIFSEENPTIE